MRALNTLNTTKVMAWVGVLDTQIIGPYFFENNVDSDAYEEMLTDFLLPELSRRGYDPSKICYMHDGAPAHYTNNVRTCLSDNFGSWIGRGEGAEIAWPARSPDLNPLDFFLWSFVRSKAYRIQPDSIEDLKLKVGEALDNITEEMLLNVQANISRRLHYCIEKEGHHIEHNF